MAKRPLNHFTYEESNQNGTRTATICSYPVFFKNDLDEYEEVDTNIVSSQDIGWDWEVKKGVFKLRIKNDGTFEVNHLGDIYSQKLEGLGFFNADTKQRVVRSAPTLSNPIVSGSEITWDLPLGSTYKLVYSNNYFKDILTISQSAKEWLNARRPAGWNTNDMWLALIYDMDLTQSNMIESKDFEKDTDHINFKQNDRVKHRIKDAEVKHSLWVKPKRINEAGDLESQRSLLKWRKKKFYRNGKYVEAIRVVALDSEDGSLTFNTDVTFQEGVSGYAGTIDSYLYDSDTNQNHGTETVIEVGNQFGSGTRRGFIKFDVTSIPSGAVVSSASMVLFSNQDDSGTDTINAYRMFKPWTEGDGTNNSGVGDERWDGVNSWGTIHCTNADDGGSENSGNGTGADRTATPEDSRDVISGDMTWNITTAVQNWVNGTWSNYGLHLWITGTVADGHDFSSSEHGTTANRPELLVTYTVGTFNASVLNRSVSAVGIVKQVDKSNNVIVGLLTIPSPTITTGTSATFNCSAITSSLSVISPTLNISDSVSASPILINGLVNSVTTSTPDKNVSVNCVQGSLLVVPVSVQITDSVTVSPITGILSVVTVTTSTSSATNVSVNPITGNLSVISPAITVSVSTNVSPVIQLCNIPTQSKEISKIPNSNTITSRVNGIGISDTKDLSPIQIIATLVPLASLGSNDKNVTVNPLTGILSVCQPSSSGGRTRRYIITSKHNQPNNNSRVDIGVLY